MHSKWLVKSIEGSLEYDLLRRIYAVLFFQILLSTVYPFLLQGTADFVSFPERCVRGLTLLFLAWRAAHFQLMELVFFPEGKFGRVFGLLLPIAFIAGTWFSFRSGTGKFWGFYIAAVSLLFWVKIVPWKFPVGGSEFLERPAKGSYLFEFIKSWHRNAALLMGATAAAAAGSLSLNWQVTLWGWQTSATVFADLSICLGVYIFITYYLIQGDVLSGRTLFSDLENLLKKTAGQPLEPPLVPSLIDYFAEPPAPKTP